MKISVIVPVYKVEQYLDRCLNSIVNQTYRELEIILVDDGSPDSCPQMCEDWARKDRRIKVIHKQNEGLGLARNSGLAEATGEYVSFVDSDDYIDTNAYAEIVAKIREDDPDVCYFSLYILKHDGSVVTIDNPYPQRVENSEIRTDLIPTCFGKSLRRTYDSYILGSSWMGVYRRELLAAHHIAFKSERQYLCEDYIFTLEVCLYARRVSFIKAPFYYYCENQSSLTHSYRKDRLEKSEILYRYMVSLIQKNDLGDASVLRAQDCFLVNIIVCLKQEITNKDGSYSSKIESIRNICRSEITAEVTKHYPLRELPPKRMILLLALRLKMLSVLYFITNLKLLKSDT
jgi:glycosyltransferase involved in cell wall biosynthesis